MEFYSNYEFLVEPQLLTFYGLWQLVVCLFAFVALMAIWWHIGRKSKDSGQVWLALSILCWSFSGCADVYYSSRAKKEGSKVYRLLVEIMDSENPSVKVDQYTFQQEIMQLKQFQEIESQSLEGWRSVFSLFNSLFILLSLPWFRYIPKRLEPLIKSKYWTYIAGLPFLFSLLPTVSKMISGQRYSMISELDVYYAILTLGFLGAVLWESFAKRRLRILAWLSVACILITLIAQLYKFSALEMNLILLTAIFKTSLIMIFFALALSWVKELAENIILDPDRLFLSFSTRKNQQGKFEYLVQLTGIPGNNNLPILLTPALYELFLKFARQKEREGEDWLEIKPKNRGPRDKVYDINDHNEIKRLLVALLDGIFGKDKWLKNLHGQSLKTTLFEVSDKRNRKIRLRLPSRNISLPPR